ncbi:unnamed protein product [Prunus armeniaca]
MVNHLIPLFIIANFGGIPIPKIMVDEGVAMNLLPHKLLVELVKMEKDLIPTRHTVTNFVEGITNTRGILDVNVIVRTKKLKIAFFVVDTTSTIYNALLVRDWIHQNLCVPSTLHQQLASSMKRSIKTLAPMVSWPRGSSKKVWLMFSSNQQEKDEATIIRSIINRLLVYWEEMKLSMQNPAINLAEFMHESAEEQEESLQEEELEFAPATLDDSLP